MFSCTPKQLGVWLLGLIPIVSYSYGQVFLELHNYRYFCFTLDYRISHVRMHDMFCISATLELCRFQEIRKGLMRRDRSQVGTGW